MKAEIGDVSTKLVDMIPQEVTGLQELLNQPMPEDYQWSEEEWRWVLKGQFQEKIVALWATNRLILDLGWIEHTGDWDWYLSFTFADGTTRQFDCGTYLIGFTDSKGQLHKTLGSLKEAWEFGRSSDWKLTDLHIEAMWWEDDTLQEDELAIDIWTLDGIHLGYDT